MNSSPSAYAADETASGVPAETSRPDNNEDQVVEVEVPPERQRMMGIQTVAVVIGITVAIWEFVLTDRAEQRASLGYKLRLPEDTDDNHDSLDDEFERY